MKIVSTSVDAHTAHKCGRATLERTTQERTVCSFYVPDVLIDKQTVSFFKKQVSEQHTQRGPTLQPGICVWRCPLVLRARSPVSRMQTQVRSLAACTAKPITRVSRYILWTLNFNGEHKELL